MSGNNHVRLTLILFFGSLAAAAIYSRGAILPLINSLFLFGLTLLVIAGGITVISGGFFDAFLLGFRVLRRSRHPEDAYEEPAEENGDEENRKAIRTKRIASACFVAGALNTGLSYGLMWFILN